MLSSVLAPSRCVLCRRMPGDPRCRCIGAGRPSSGAPITAVDRILIAGAHDGPTRGLVLDLKLRGRRDAAGPLVESLVRTIYSEGLLGDLITWVPGNRKGCRARGFDHAELLARGLARRCGLEARPLLQRRTNIDQAGLSRRARIENLRDAITARACIARSVVLVDDVVTTGATAIACAAALKHAGAARVEVVAASRA